MFAYVKKFNRDSDRWEIYREDFPRDTEDLDALPGECGDCVAYVATAALADRVIFWLEVAGKLRFDISLGSIIS